MKEANGKRTIFASKETYVGKIIEKETEMEKCVEKRNGEMVKKNEEKKKEREATRDPSPGSCCESGL